jgi:hypothetical protein
MQKNEEWLSAAKENFQSALDAGDVSLAKDIIADTFDAGFPDAARSMAAQLKAANL